MERYNVREGIILKTFFCLDIVKHIIMRVQKRLISLKYRALGISSGLVSVSFTLLQMGLGIFPT